MADGDKEGLHFRRGRLQRMKAGLRLDYDARRDCVGWSSEQLRRVEGMPGFVRCAAVAQVDPDAQAVSCADIDGDGADDVCLVGAGRVAVFKNGGDSLDEIRGVANLELVGWQLVYHHRFRLCDFRVALFKGTRLNL